VKERIERRVELQYSAERMSSACFRAFAHSRRVPSTLEGCNASTTITTCVHDNMRDDLGIRMCVSRNNEYMDKICMYVSSNKRVRAPMVGGFASCRYWELSAVSKDSVR